MSSVCLRHQSVEPEAATVFFSEGDVVVEPRFVRKGPCCLNNE